jgi:hypothetical protein
MATWAVNPHAAWTAATGAEVRAARRGAHEAFLQHAGGVGVFVRGFFAVCAVYYLFIRQCAVDENGLAVDVGDPAAFVVKGFDQSNGLLLSHYIGVGNQAEKRDFLKISAPRRGFCRGGG